MIVTLNGKVKVFAAPLTVRELLEALDLDSTRVAVELNLEILPRDQFSEKLLKEGDRLEVVQFVGGG
ncbi:MAG: sulfur carrier protein ThiS [Desulfuromonadales bacterium]